MIDRLVVVNRRKGSTPQWEEEPIAEIPQAVEYVTFLSVCKIMDIVAHFILSIGQHKKLDTDNSIEKYHEFRSFETNSL